jgi:hypothetical protein
MQAAKPCSIDARRWPQGFQSHEALSLAIDLFLMPKTVLIMVKGPLVSGARAVAEKPGNFCKSRIVLVDKDRMAFYS